MKKRNLMLQTVGCVAVAFLFLVPLWRLVLMSFTQHDGSFSFGNYTALLQEPRTLRAIGNTVVISLAATALSTVLGVLFAFVVAYLNIRRKKLLELLVLAPFIIPSYVITISWTSALAGNGEVNRLLRLLHLGPVNLYSLGGIIFILGICNIPLVYLTTVNMLRKIPRDLEWAARASFRPFSGYRPPSPYSAPIFMKRRSASARRPFPWPPLWPSCCLSWRSPGRWEFPPFRKKKSRPTASARIFRSASF